jgi:hypothetical protein
VPKRRPRPTIAIDVELPEKPAITGLSDAAFRIYIEALCYCGRQKTDGNVPRRVARLMHDLGEAAADELVRAGLWRVAGDGGFDVSGYLQWQLSREDWQRLSNARSKAARSRWGSNVHASCNANAMQDQDQDQEQDQDHDQDHEDRSHHNHDGGTTSSPALSRERARASADVVRLCELLADHVEHVLSLRRPKVTDAWLRPMRLLLADHDGNALVVERAIAWLAKPGDRSDFWARNVRSPVKLRKHFDAMALDARAQRATRSSGGASADALLATAERLRREGR